MAKAKSGVPAGHHTVTPHLIMNDAASALDWYAKALGAKSCRARSDRTARSMHAEIRIGDSLIMLNDEMGGGKSPKALGGSPVSLWLYVDDCDALFKRAVAAGAKVPPGPMGEMADQFWGDRCGGIIDPEGYIWTIATRKEDLTPEEINAARAGVLQEFRGRARSRRRGAVASRGRRLRRAAVARFLGVVLGKTDGLLQILELHRRCRPFGVGETERAPMRIAWIETFSSVNG